MLVAPGGHISYGGNNGQTMDIISDKVSQGVSGKSNKSLRAHVSERHTSDHIRKEFLWNGIDGKAVLSDLVKLALSTVRPVAIPVQRSLFHSYILIYLKSRK